MLMIYPRIALWILRLVPLGNVAISRAQLGLCCWRGGHPEWQGREDECCWAMGWPPSQGPQSMAHILPALWHLSGAGQ